MKLTANSTTLAKALTGVRGVVPAKSTIPILGNVLMRAKNDALHLRATDLDIEVSTDVSAVIAEPGETTVPAGILLDILRKLPKDAEAALAIDDGRLTIKSGRSRFKLQMLPTSDYPDLQAGEPRISFEMTGKSLHGLWGRASFAISTEETRYYLNGIYFHSMTVGNVIKTRAVATDGHRLARIEIDAPAGAEQMAGIIVPRFCIEQALKLTPDTEDAKVAIEISETKIRLRVGGWVLMSKLIDGTFPDYARVVPSGNTKHLKVDRKECRASVDRVCSMSSERGRSTKLAINGDKLTLSSVNPDMGEAVDEISCEWDGGDPLEIGFNGRYLLDILDELAPGLAVFEMEDPGSPTILRSDGATDSLYVLMPMRV